MDSFGFTEAMDKLGGWKDASTDCKATTKLFWIRLMPRLKEAMWAMPINAQQYSYQQFIDVVQNWPGRIV